MKFFTWKRAPNPRRVAMFLAEKQLDIDTVEVGEPGQPKLSDEYLRSNRHRVVPALELDDGTVIGEAFVICRYLERQFPEHPLLGVDAKSAATIEMWDRKVEYEGMHAAAEIFRNKVGAFKGRALPGYDRDIDQIDALVDRGKIRMQAFYDKLNAHLGDHECIAGDAFSMADITAFCAIEFARQGKLEPSEDNTHLLRWLRAVGARDSAKA